MAQPNPYLNPDRLFAIEEQLIASAAHFKLSVPRSAPALRNHLMKLSPELLSAIGQNMENMAQNLLTCMDTGIDPWDDHEFFLLSMKSLGLSFPKDFLDHVQRDDLIEGYDMNRFQIFRNMRFMEMINYSLLEVLSHEWPQLYDRAGAITDKMITYCDEILWGANKTIPFSVPTHHIREMRSQQRQFFEIQFKYISPLFKGPNSPAGLLGTFRARSIELEKKEDGNLSFV